MESADVAGEPNHFGIGKIFMSGHGCSGEAKFYDSAKFGFPIAVVV